MDRRPGNPDILADLGSAEARGTHCLQGQVMPTDCGDDGLLRRLLGGMRVSSDEQCRYSPENNNIVITQSAAI